MITIKVGGTPLYIPTDTVVVLEQNNNIFNSDGITEDIVWTFSIPAKPNQIVLGAVQYNNVSGHKRYDCELSFNGIPFATGKIYVQSATDEKTLYCGIITNSFGVGFGEKKLNENDYGSDVVISETEDGHKSSWKAFLEGSLNANSIYKFFLFCSEKFYQENEDYGFHQNTKSPLMNRIDDKQWYQYVNRLFFDSNNTVYDNEETNFFGNIVQGVRLFNTPNREKQNGYCFAPAIRLDWILRAILANARLRAGGTFFTDSNIKRLFLQSLCALDGDVFQYGVNTWININGDVSLYNDTITNCQPFKTNGQQDTHTAFGWGNSLTVGFRLLLPSDELVRHATFVSAPGWSFGAQYFDEVYALWIGTDEEEMPSMRMSLNITEEDGTNAFKYGRPMSFSELKNMAGVSSEDTFEILNLWSISNSTANVEYSVNGSIFSHTRTLPLIHTTHSTLVQLTPSEGKNVFYRTDLGGYTEGSVLQRIYNDVPATTKQYIKLVKCKIATARGQTGTFWTPTDGSSNLPEYGTMEKIYDYEILTDQAIDTTDTPLNIFSKILRWRDHVPDMTNGEFLNRICQIFGLNMFVSPLDHEIQMSFFTDTLKGGAFDISQWIVQNEKMEYKSTRYEVKLTSALGTKGVAEKNILPTVKSCDRLPGAFLHKNKHAFVSNENAYRRSSKQDNSSLFKWDQAGGNDTKLTAGSVTPESTEEVSIETKVPNMRLADEKVNNATAKYICEIPLSGCSPMFDENYDGKFDLVIQQYKGRRLVVLGGGPVTNAYIEDANPTCYDENGNIDNNYITLSADGKNSIGQRWLKNLYDFKGNCENFRFVAKLPAWAFLEVYKTLKPQNGNPNQQIRWIYVKGNRYLPTKISYEFGDGETVLTTIECARRHYD